MTQKYVFRNGSLPLLYDITQKKKTLFHISIPKEVYRQTFDDIEEKNLRNHFGIKKCIDYSEEENFIILTINLADSRPPTMEGLCHIFDFLNMRKNKDVSVLDPNTRQIMTFNVQGTGLAVSLAPLVCDYLRDETHARHIFAYVKKQMQEMHHMLMPKSNAHKHLDVTHTTDGFQFYLFSNGILLGGDYDKNEFDTHNCDTYIDQAVFFTACVALCDALRHYLTTGEYLS